MTRAFHGTGEQAIKWLVEEYREFEHDAFLRMWHQGDAEAEWPEFYEWLDRQPIATLDLKTAAIDAALCLSGFAGEGITVDGYEDPVDAWFRIARALGMPDADEDDLRVARAALTLA
jgi:hypothetical protein